MKKERKRLVALFLALILLLSFAACGEKTPDNTTQNTPSTPNTPDDPAPDPDPEVIYDLREYTVVYSHKIYMRTLDAVNALAATLSDELGIEYAPKIDAAAESTGKEILVGDTNRPESAQALALVTDDETFVIKTVGDKIVINAKNNAMLILAINHFVKMAEENMFSFASDVNYVSSKAEEIVISQDGNSKFDIIYLEGLLTSGGTEGKAELEVQLARELAEAIKATYGAELDVKNSAKLNEYEILIGETPRDESASFISSLAPNEYGFEIVGNRIVIAGTNPTSTRLAVGVFTEALNSFDRKEGSAVTAALYKGMRVTRRNARWNTDVPEFEGGEYGGAHDGANGAFVLIYKETTPEAFENYCKKLETEGYALWQRHDMENNLHATYVHETRGMIHTYYTASEASVRIVSYKDGCYNLPTNNAPYEYEKITESSITGYGISGGMCFVITLADGSFIVVDSGTSNTSDRFYQLLKDLNKRPDGKIIIKAWYLTHEHSDHFLMFSKFMTKYGKDVTIEEFWCNPATIDFTHYGDNRNVMWVASYPEYKNYVNGDFEWKTLHTGMEFYAANMKFEVLYTEEDLFPQRCYSYNDNILIMKMTDMLSGQTMLWTGDLLVRGCKTLANNYDEYLKCDLLQAAHHAKSEALPVYQKVKPTVVFWPTSSTNKKKAETTNGGIYAESIRFLDENALVHFTYDNIYTVNFPVKDRDSMIKWSK